MAHDIGVAVEGIYPILDVGTRVGLDGAPELFQDLIDGGAKFIQLRAKSLPSGPHLSLARTLVEIAKPRGVALIINDRPDVALLSGAAGVHLGQSDLPAELVRRMLPRPMIIGVSCHTITELLVAKSKGAADYYALGPIYATSSKLDPEPEVGVETLALAVRMVEPLPVVAIGGIDRARLADVRRAGARAVAMISAIQSAADPKDAVRALLAAWSAA